MGIPTDRRPETVAASPYNRAPDSGWRHPYGSLAEGGTGMAGPTNEHRKNSARLELQLGPTCPGQGRIANGQTLDLGTIRAIDPWGKRSLVLKWRRWRVAYPDEHNQVIPDPTDMYIPEEL